jgi:DNA-binding NarL/FixJ family response regulator
MPDGEGLELIGALRMANPKLKVIAISGAFEGQFLKAAELLGAKATIQKPFEVDTLLAVVRKVMAESSELPN